MKTKQFNVNLTPEEHQKIKQEADRLRGTKGQVIRLALATYFKINRGKK